MFNRGTRGGSARPGGQQHKSYHAVPGKTAATANLYSNTQYMEAMLKRHRTEAE